LETDQWYRAGRPPYCDEDTPHLITHVETTAATTPDDAVTGPIHDDLAAQHLLPGTHLVYAGYTTAEQLVRSRADHGIDLLGPVAANGSWQARAGLGFDLSQFTIEWQTQTVVCPQGKRSRVWEPRRSPVGTPQIHVRFHREDCRACAVRPACTRSKTDPRALTFQPQAQQLALQAARERQATPAFKEQYALRAGAESCKAQEVRPGYAARSYT
jgi:transposase